MMADAIRTALAGADEIRAGTAWEHGDPALYGGLGAPPDGGPAAGERLAPVDRVEWDAPAVPARRRGRHEGTVLHAFFAAIGFLDQEGDPSDEALLTVAREQGVEEAEARGHLLRFRQLLAQDALRAELSSPQDTPAERLALWRERPFAVADVPGHEGTVLTGAFDRVVIERTRPGPWCGPGWWISRRTQRIQWRSAPPTSGRSSRRTRRSWENCWGSGASRSRRCWCSCAGR